MTVVKHTRTLPRPILGAILRGGSGDLGIDVEELLVGRLVICADSGAGKSWCLRRVLEICYGFALEWVIDIEGEFASLREIGDFLIVGGEYADLAVPRLPAGKGVQAKFEAEVALLVHDLLSLNANVVFDLYDLPTEIDDAARAAVTKGTIHDPTKAGFVAAFFKALIDLPKKMWVPMLVAVDEAQALAPEEGGKKTPALVPMCNWGTLSRKRGQGPVYAVNSLAMIANAAIRGFQNHLYGSQSLDADNARAAKNLRLDAAGREEVKKGLEKGEFLGYGAALSRELVKVKVGEVRSTHPRPGKPLGVVPAPSEVVKKVLAAIQARQAALVADPTMPGIDEGDAPAAVLRARLEAAHVRIAEMAGAHVALQEKLDVVRADRDAQVDHLKERLEKATEITVLPADLAPLVYKAEARSIRVQSTIDEVKNALTEAGDALAEATQAVVDVVNRCPNVAPAADLLDFHEASAEITHEFLFGEEGHVRSLFNCGCRPSVTGNRITHGKLPAQKKDTLVKANGLSFHDRPGVENGPSPAEVDAAEAAGVTPAEVFEAIAALPAGLSPGEHIVLTAIAQHRTGVTDEQLAVLTNYKKTSRETYLKKLRARGFVIRTADPRHLATIAGVEALGVGFTALPTGKALRNHWLARLKDGERTVLEPLLSRWPAGVGREELLLLTGYKQTSLDTYLKKLCARNLVEKLGDGTHGASPMLFEAGAKKSDYAPLPTGRDLQEYWMEKLPPGEGAVLQVFLNSWPESVDGPAIEKATGYKATSRATYVKKLRARKLVQPAGDTPGEWKASELFFEKQGKAATR